MTALRATFWAIAVTGLLGVAGWQLLSSADAAVEPTFAVGQVPAAEIDSAEGSAPASSAIANSRATFPIMRATTPAEVRQVLQIAREATGKDCPALLHAALHAEDPLVCGNAAKALGRLKAFSSDEALLALIADPRMRVRQDAVVASGLDGRVEAIPFLEKALAEGDATTRPLIVDALGRIGGPAARALLEGVASDPGSSQTDRVFVRVALDRME